MQRLKNKYISLFFLIHWRKCCLTYIHDLEIKYFLSLYYYIISLKSKLFVQTKCSTKNKIFLLNCTKKKKNLLTSFFVVHLIERLIQKIFLYF